MATTSITGGFVIDRTKVEPEAAPAQPQTHEEQLLSVIATRLHQGFPKAAFAAANELARHIATTYGL